MNMELYQVSGAPRPWRVLLGLAFKGLQADIHTLSYVDRDLQKPEFLKINPRATVPVLVSGTTILRDSIGILAWLDRAYPEKPLFGETPNEAALIWQVALECADYLREGNRQLLTKVFSSDGTVPEEGSPEAASLKAAADMLHAECTYVEDILSDGRAFLTGERPTAADAVAFPEIRLVQRAVVTKHDLMKSVGFGSPPDRYPFTAAWKARLNDMPEVAATLPAHWKEPAAAA